MVDAVGDHDAGARVLESVAADRPQIPFAQIDHAGIDLDKGRAVHRVVFQHLFQQAAIAAADNQDLAGAPMRQQRQVRQHLVIDEFVAFGRLDDAVQCENAAEFRILEQDQLLMVALAFVEHLVDA